jgi:WD40 repeat protein
MTQLQELKGQTGVLYAVSWAPADDAAGGGDTAGLLASSGSEGDVFIWDTKSGSTITRAKHHSKPVYGLRWHNTDKELLASTSSDGYAVIFNPAGKVLRKFKHPAAAYGVDWSPFHPALIATGCHDGIVRVFDASPRAESTKPLIELVGHTARVFHAVWSPLVPDRIASGSDDKTIRIWDTSSGAGKPLVTLTGHTHNVRGLAWSSEVPWMLLSGSWDGTIRVWDTREPGRCLAVVDDHHADVYGLTSHPSRPFVFVSTSRDTSLRIWNMDESTWGPGGATGAASRVSSAAVNGTQGSAQGPSVTNGVAPIKLQAILEGGLLLPSHLDHVDSALHRSAALHLCGPVSAALVHGNGKPGSALKDMKDLDRYARLFDYFTATSGVKELWRLVDALVNNKPTEPATMQQQLLHINDVRAAALSSARALSSSKTAGIIGIGKRSDRLESAAAQYTRLDS